MLPTVAARALEITHADAVLIYGYDAANQQFNLAEAIGIDKAAEGGHLAIDEAGSLLGEAAAKGEPIAIPDLDATADHPLRDVAIAAGFHSVLVVPLVDQQGVLGSLVVLRQERRRILAEPDRADATFAHQSVLAMRNARLFTEVDHKGRELRDRALHRAQQADKLQEQTDQLKDWNKSLEERVEKQLGEIERIRRLERFLAPQVAQLIASSDGHEGLLDSHRREVTVVFCDLRGFTAFTESTEPEEAMNVLREYHAALGELIFRYEGTLDRYAGDGVMILFNAPIQFEDHTKRAVKMAVEMRDTIGALTEKWRNRGHNLGFGIGIALGYATLGQIGFEQRLEYAAIGSVTNLASRLCDEAKANQIVVSRRVYGMVEQWVEGRADRRSASEGLQSSGAGGGDPELARGGRQRGGCRGVDGAAEEEVIAVVPALAGLTGWQTQNCENNPMQSRNVRGAEHSASSPSTMSNSLDVNLRRHCEERSDAAIQPFAPQQDGLLRFARNDG